MRTKRLVVWASALAVVTVLVWVAEDQVPAIAAGGLLHPARQVAQQPVPANCDATTFRGADVALAGWRCASSGARKGTLIYLHGIADNRGSAVGAIRRYTAQGLDVIAYDSRAHGESDGTACTYGYFEKLDLSRVVDTIEPQPIVLLGTSLGGAVAIQTAAIDPRISSVVAAEVFSDLRTIAGERAPWMLPESLIAKAFRVAEGTARFDVDAVSPWRAAATIRIPTLLIHGAADRDTKSAHSERVFSALAGPKRLILVDGAGHNESLRQEKIWGEIDAWIESALSPP
jgi:uncharacterized protein